MIKKQVIEDIEKKLTKLGWKPLDDYDKKVIFKNLPMTKPVKSGFSFYINEKKDEEVEIEGHVFFAGKTYQRMVLVYVMFLEDGGIYIHESCSYYIFPYIKNDNFLGKQWELDKDNIDHWTTLKTVSDYKEAIYYINHLKDIDKAWDKENALMKKYNELPYDVLFKRMQDSLDARLNNKKYEDEYSHMHMIVVDWDEDAEYYSELWGDTEEASKEYYRILDFNRNQIPEKR